MELRQLCRFGMLGTLIFLRFLPALSDAAGGVRVVEEDIQTSRRSMQHRSFVFIRGNTVRILLVFLRLLWLLSISRFSTSQQTVA